ncbi:endonuclease [Lachancea thermotolerans CBS 6340]|uniref:KLTH0H06358p n=1 Tax=Lachancea thermotolerans (strain ATCC 56472 / CBS 6340 / NRRL Y-8284) TaxID=559295 RepID=C5E2N3_LACTC|nr:KLTH0H06358p [Lachancea thermotolerans CBS 6340]CAR30294.1 KLTH0H06358p [Lachancea thermotolerans CBS 6340]
MKSRSKTKQHAIPDFYCCYLLRSVPKKQSFYIGSTPNPVRRLRQHNGTLANGSAYRTKKTGFRPWRMIACVYGFTSKIAALQFEHAWQHSNLTHFIDDDQRIVTKKAGGRTIHHKLGNIRLLIKNEFFSYMNLKVHLFCAEAVDAWSQNKFLIDCDIPNVTESLEPPASKEELQKRGANEFASENLVLVEKLYKSVLRADDERVRVYQEALYHGCITCPICHKDFNYMSDEDSPKPLVAFCPTDNCQFLSHLSCLHRIFVDDEQALTGVRKLLPHSGSCPSCDKKIFWTKVVKYSTRLRETSGPQQDSVPSSQC